GKFYACGNFPKCTYKESIVEDAGVPCPKDGGKVVMKRTRTGRTFFGCANYPKCTFAVWTKEQLVKETQTETPQTTPTN
ncbi:MAG: topoisomerase DNA-binding C4 zinc finger domain-containing protein, partial [Candidatus Woesearchaeota archaeon]|nr:topoisomerase DNA-binding C4 zinc finger domain-containing protein [Candidatus Woesearchaeota archaeon]